MSNMTRINGRPTAMDLAIFCRQCESFLSCGVPVVSTLNYVEEMTENKMLKRTILAVGMDVEAGQSLYASTRTYSKVFPEIFSQMMEVGESTGSLEDVLLWLAKYFEEQNTEEMYFQKMVVAPVLVGFVLVSVRMAMLQQSFTGWYYLALGLCALLTMFQKQGMGLVKKFLYFFGVSNDMEHKKAESRIAEILSLSLSLGSGVTDSLEYAIKTCENVSYRKALEVIKVSVSEGSTISYSAAETGRFSSYFCNMSSVGESVGQFEKILKEIASTHEKECEINRKRNEACQQAFAESVFAMGFLGILSGVVCKTVA